MISSVSSCIIDGLLPDTGFCLNPALGDERLIEEPDICFFQEGRTLNEKYATIIDQRQGASH